MPLDPWLSERLRVVKAIVAGEERLYAAVLDTLTRWVAKLRGLVLGPHGGVDPAGVFATEPWFANQVDDIEIVVREIVDDAAHDYADDIHPDAQARVRDFLRGSKNRLVRVPDTVYGAIRQQTMKASAEGWSVDDLQAQVQKILDDTGSEVWRNRARVIARTEIVGAYNTGTFAGFVSVAEQTGGEWEKVWLDTDDERTRPTHVAAGGQRRPLLQPFRVGDADLMYPGVWTGPPEEIIQCRCSILLVRPGEEVSYSNRQYKGGQ